MMMAQSVKLAIFIFGTSLMVKSVRHTVEDSDSASNSECDKHSVQGFDVKGAQAGCEACTQKKGCKWCPLDQRCVQSGSTFFGNGVSCSARPGFAIDEKIKNHKKCKRTPPWHEILLTSFGQDYHRQLHQIADGLKCVEWLLQWNMSGVPDKDQDDEGLWGCMSAMLRSTLLWTLGSGYHWSGQDRTREDRMTTAYMPARPAAMLLQEGSNQTIFGQSKRTVSANNITRPTWYYDRRTWEPKLCDLFKLQFPGEPCYMRTWKISQFEDLMRAWHNTDNFTEFKTKMANSIKAGPLQTMVPGAGKSGSTFAMLADASFKLKFGVKYSSLVNEPDNLMNLINPPSSTKPLLKHFQENPDSLLNRVYGMFKLRIGEKDPYVLLMDDAFYNMDAKINEQRKKEQAQNQIVYTRYDLKGLSRNQSERQFKGYCLVNGDFKAMEQARVRLQDEQCLAMRKAMEADATFLTEHNMIDYSLLLLSAKPKFRALTDESTTDATPAYGEWSFPDCTAGEPFCMKHKDHLYTFSIIDYLNKFNVVKTLESAIRGGKFTRYGHQLTVFVRKICPTASEKMLQKKLHMLMKEQGGSMKDAWQGSDADGSGKVNMTEIKDYFKNLGFKEKEFVKYIQSLEFAEEDEADFEEFKLMLS